MNFYSFSDYRKLIQQLISIEKNNRSGITIKKIAEVARIQPPYLSNVLAGKAQLNSDQLFLIVSFFGRTEEEIEFAQLLLELDKCSIRERRNYLSKKIKNIRRENTKTEKQIDFKTVVSGDTRQILETLFLVDANMWISKIFMSLDKPFNRSEVEKYLNINSKTMTVILDNLKRAGLVDEINGQYSVTSRDIHISKDHPLVDQFHLSMRSKSQAILPILDENDKKLFTGVFTGDDEFFESILLLIDEFKMKLTSMNRKASSRKVFQLNLDFFKWTRST